MYNRLMAFIERNGVLTEAQHGFRTKKSTETALQIFINNTQEVIEKKTNPTGIFVHITKAYDLPNHKVLLSKPNCYGIRGVANLLFESYLSHRKQCVEINSVKQGIYVSTTREIEYGVPQSSILGPILFSLFINDLPLNVMGSKIVLFTDDTNILVSEANMSNLQSKLNNVMNELQTWLTLNSLVVNVQKTLVMSFRTAQNKKPVLPQVIFEGRDIPYDTETKFLGVYINENMKRNSHIKYLSSKLNTSSYVINSLKNVMSPYVLRTIYFSCFHVLVRYGLTLWGGDPESIRIFRLQKKVIRIIVKAG
jgi:hypothetical protein